MSIGHVQDVTARREAAADLAHRALHDGLTGLPNRHLLMDRMRQSLDELNRRGGAVAVLYLDLDRFKEVNDSLGHEAGDRLLIEAARRLAPTVRAPDTAARLGGDEFVLVGHVTEAGAAEHIAGRVHA